MRLIALSIFVLLLSGFCGAASGEEAADTCARPYVEKVERPDMVWQPGPEGEQVALWAEEVAVQPPDLDGHAEMVGNGSPLVADELWHWATYISRPTMTLYPPMGENNGTAMLVLPGGGYAAVAMDLEGTEICDWVTGQGMTCVLLKYRVPLLWKRDESGVAQPPKDLLPLEDAQRAMGLLRQRAASYGIDPDRIGVIGFSARGHLGAVLSNTEARIYDPVDAADDQPARPDFAILLYPGRLWYQGGSKTDLSLAPWMAVSAEAPPTLLIHAMNDPVDDVRQSMAYGLALNDLGVPVDMRFFAGGCHAFGMRPTDDPITTQWPRLAVQWLRDLGMLDAG